MHDTFVQISRTVMDNLGLPVYNQVVQLIAFLIGLLVSGILIWKLFTQAGKTIPKLTFLLITLVLMAIHYLTMFEMNIEIIHVLEFALLAFLIYPLAKSFWAAIVFSIPFMVFNELYQYLVLYPNYIEYFELNDIVLDILGCGLMMSAVWILGDKPKSIKTPVWKTPAFLTLTGLLTLTFLGIATCLFALNSEAACDHSIFIFNQMENLSGFWTVHHFTGAEYHILRPMEGIITIALVVLVYLPMDYLALD